MITKAAVKIYDKRQGKEVILPCHRHSDIPYVLYALGYKKIEDYLILEEGFLTEDDVFLNRHFAWLDAITDNQLLIKNNDYQELYSEDLW